VREPTPGLQFISAEIASKGPVATQHTVVRNMRAVKKEVLKLVECFVESAQVSGTCVVHEIQHSFGMTFHF
jgi:hypothetical protein